MTSPFQRLKERKLVQWAAAYLAGAWLLTEALDLVAERFYWPNWIIQGSIVLLVFGLLITIVLAWYHGEKGRQRVSGAELLIIAGLLVVAGAALSIVRRLAPEEGAVAVSDAGLSDASDPRLAMPTQKGSVAVLPFDNLSTNPDDQIFTDGFHEELLSTLAKISGLRPISRTSVMEYRGRAQNLREIAARLGVEAVVEGSVRWVGETVRITVQLIDAATDQHLWADDFDRTVTLDNLLDIQSEVALKIASALQVELAPADTERIGARPTNDLEAYTLYLKGRYALNRHTEEGFRTGVGFFLQAIDADPTYAPAHAGLGYCYFWLGHDGYVRPKEAFAASRAAAERALELDESLVHAHTLLAHLDWEHAYDWAEAERGFLRALELDPSSPDAHQWYAWFLMSLGRFEEAESELRTAQSLDPLSAIISSDLAAPFWMSGRYDRALDQYRETLELHPDYRDARFQLARVYAFKGEYEQAIALYEELTPRTLRIEAALGWVYAQAGDTAGARQVLRTLDERSKEGWVSPFHAVLIYIALGEEDAAMDRIEEAYDERLINLVWIRQAPYAPLRDNPRYQDLVRRMGFPGDA